MYKVHGIMKVEEGEVAMMKEPKYSYGYAALMGILTVIICMAVADGLIGIRGTVQNYVDLGNGYHSFDLAINDPTGKYVFWAGIIGIPILFSRKVRIKSTWINMPLFFVAWYVCTWIFGESPKHRYLGHPSSGWISIGEGLEPVGVMILFWLIQVLVLLVITVISSGLRKIKDRGI